MRTQQATIVDEVMMKPGGPPGAPQLPGRIWRCPRPQRSVVSYVIEISSEIVGFAGLNGALRPGDLSEKVDGEAPNLFLDPPKPTISEQIS